MDGRRQPRRPRRVAVAARLVVLVAALAGLFAMHGLSEHGVAGPMGMDEPARAMAHVASTHAPTASLESTAIEQVSVIESDASMGSMELCVAVLAVGLLLLLARRHLRPVSAVRSLHRLPRVTWRPRPPEPPDLFDLCIQRC